MLSERVEMRNFRYAIQRMVHAALEECIQERLTHSSVRDTKLGKHAVPTIEGTLDYDMDLPRRVTSLAFIQNAFHIIGRGKDALEFTSQVGQFYLNLVSIIF